MNLSEYFIKDSDNQVIVTLTEDDVAISTTPTEVNIVMYKAWSAQPALTITRTSFPDNGVNYASGVVTITPRSLSEDLSVLTGGHVYRVVITVKSVAETSGVNYGAGDSDDKLWFLVSDSAA